MATQTGFLTWACGEDVLIGGSPDLWVIYQADGVTPEDVTGWTITFYAYGTNGVLLFTKTATLSGPASGQITVAIASADTVDLDPGSNYSFQARRTDSGSNSLLDEGCLLLR